MNDKWFKHFCKTVAGTAMYDKPDQIFKLSNNIREICIFLTASIELECDLTLDEVKQKAEKIHELIVEIQNINNNI